MGPGDGRGSKFQKNIQYYEKNTEKHYYGCTLLYLSFIPNWAKKVLPSPQWILKNFNNLLIHLTIRERAVLIYILNRQIKFFWALIFAGLPYYEDKLRNKKIFIFLERNWMAKGSFYSNQNNCNITRCERCFFG